MFEAKIISIQRYCHQVSITNNNSLIKEINAYFLSKIYTGYLSLFYSCYIPVGVKIRGSIKFNHSFHNIFISEHSEIGCGCTILQNTTIGSNQPKDNKAPKIGNNVFIGANCNIIGGVEIGDNCIIGAGTTIAKGVIPPNSVVVGQKYKIIDRSECNE